MREPPSCRDELQKSTASLKLHSMIESTELCLKQLVVSNNNGYVLGKSLLSSSGSVGSKNGDGLQGSSMSVT